MKVRLQVGSTKAYERVWYFVSQKLAKLHGQALSWSTNISSIAERLSSEQKGVGRNAHMFLQSKSLDQTWCKSSLILGSTGEPSAETTRKVVTVSHASKAAQRLAPSERIESCGVAHVLKSSQLY